MILFILEGWVVFVSCRIFYQKFLLDRELCVKVYGIIQKLMTKKKSILSLGRSDGQFVNHPASLSKQHAECPVTTGTCISYFCF